jgi:hypothetical protein
VLACTAAHIEPLTASWRESGSSAGKPDTGRSHGVASADTARQTSPGSAQTDPRAGVHQIGDGSTKEVTFHFEITHMSQVAKMVGVCARRSFACLYHGNVHDAPPSMRHAIIQGHGAYCFGPRCFLIELTQ